MRHHCGSENAHRDVKHIVVRDDLGSWNESRKNGANGGLRVKDFHGEADERRAGRDSR